MQERACEGFWTIKSQLLWHTSWPSMWFSDMLLDERRTILSWYLSNTCYPSFSRSWKCCKGGTMSSSLTKRSSCAEVHSSTDSQPLKLPTGEDLLQPALGQAAQPSKHLAWSSSHSKVTTEWRASTAVKPNFKYVKHHVESRSWNTGGKAFCSYEKYLRTFMATKTLDSSQWPCDSCPVWWEVFAGLLLHSDLERAF